MTKVRLIRKENIQKSASRTWEHFTRLNGDSKVELGSSATYVEKVMHN